MNLNSEVENHIEEMKSLSYLERLERLMILIEVSHTLKKINEIAVKNQYRFSNSILKF